MTAVPIPSWQYQENTEPTPIIALKELVANLQREQNKIQNLLSSLGFALRSFNNLNQFLELTPLMAARVTDADGGALIMFDSKKNIHLEQLHCHDSQTCKELRKALEKIAEKINLEQQKKTPEENQKCLSDYLDEQIKDYLGTEVQVFGTQVWVKNVERGRLYVISRNQEYIFTPTRRKLVQLVADQTAVAIANHELTVELGQKERTDRELEIASEIQLRLLPRKCPRIKGVELAAKCKTASRVGGDYYDFIPTNYDQSNSHRKSVPWSIVIGDVMGKGVPAGLIMTMTRGFLRAEVLNRHSPGRILQHLNRVMYADLENSHRFVTLFYSEYDPETQILSYSNAAHNPPLLWQAKTKKIERLDTLGMLVGLEMDSDYEDGKVKLNPGDTIIYYTDGFTDAMNPNGEIFDEENLTAAFKWACENCRGTQAILNHLFGEVQLFIGSGNNNSDDMTIIVMQIQENYS